MILFPQLLCVVHFPDWCNTYGSLFSYCLGLSIRVTGGESLVGLPPLIHFPGFQEPTQEEVRLPPGCWGEIGVISLNLNLRLCF